MICTSVGFKSHLFKHEMAAYSPVEFVVRRICFPFSDAGFLRMASASLGRAISALIADCSLMMPMVRSFTRAAPRTAGAEPMPPTSHDFEGTAATCGAPEGKELNFGSSPTCFHQPF